MVEGLLVEFLVAAAIQVAVVVGLRAWAAWVAERQGSTFFRRARLLPLAALFFAMTGIGTGLVFFFRGFAAVENGDASMKATILAQSISTAMNCTALFALATAICYLASIAISIAGTVREPR